MLVAIIVRPDCVHLRSFERLEMEANGIKWSLYYSPVSSHRTSIRSLRQFILYKFDFAIRNFRGICYQDLHINLNPEKMSL